MRCAAFLRGINVGGHKPVKMDDLGRIFASLGCADVKTYIQSGNVVFDTTHTDLASLTLEIEARLAVALGYEVATMVRTASMLHTIVELNPFAALTMDAGAKPYVTFLRNLPSRDPALPLASSRQDVEVFARLDGNLFSLSREVKGRYGFPNQFIEDELGVIATTRNWNTVRKVASLAAAQA